MVLGQGHHSRLLPERQAVQARFVMRAEKDRHVRSAATQVAEKLLATAFDHGQLDTTMPTDEPQQGIAKPPDRGREIGPNDQLTDGA
jgi:hypothetical protein